MHPPQEPTPKTLVESLLSEAGWVLQLAKRLARDQAAAEDIAQGTLALALEKRPRADAGLRPWLARVASRLARRSVRSEVRRQVREARVADSNSPRSSTGGSDEALIRFELQQDLARQVAALPEPYRRVLIGRYYEGHSVEEIAEVTGAPPSTVRSRLARGLERLRAQYTHGTDGRSALGLFMVAAGSDPAALTRRTAQIVLMQTSAKVAIATASILAAAIGISGSFLGPVERPALGTSGSTTETSSALAVDGPSEADSGFADPGGSRTTMDPSKLGSAAAVAEETASPGATVTTLRARILGTGFEPLVGATLASVYPDGRPRGEHNVARSDADGIVVLELDDADLRMWRDNVLDMNFAVGAEGHGTSFLIQQPRLHAETDLGELHLESGGTLVGRCVDAQGRPISGAILMSGPGVLTRDLGTLRITGPDAGTPRPRAVSREDGSFELAGVPHRGPDGLSATARLWAHAPAHLWTVSDPVSIPSRSRIDLGTIVLDEVSPGRRIEGRVTLPNGNSASGAQVDYFSHGTPMEGHVLADASGNFVVVPRDDSVLELLARDPRQGHGPSSAVLAERGETIELRLEGRRIARVSVVDPDGNPVDDAHLMPVLVDTLDPEANSRLMPGEAWTYTDAKGEAEILLPGQAFTVWVRKFGFGEAKVGPFEPTSAPEHILATMPARREITGRVLAYGEPVAGAQVTALRWHPEFAAMTGGFPNRYPSGVPGVTTDSDGRFVVPIKLGLTKIGLIAQHDGHARDEVQLELAPGEGARGVELRLTDGGILEGKVQPPAGMEAPGLIVAASRGDGMAMSTRVDVEGRYRLEGLTPGPWRVEGRLQPVRTELLSISRHPDDLRVREDVVVVDRGVHRFDVDMGHLGEVAVHGHFRINGAAPTAGWIAEIVMPPHARTSTEQAPASLDDDGRFVLTTTFGRGDLRLTGSLPGGARVEVLRELQFRGPRLDWEESLTTAEVQDFVPGDPDRVRLLRGTDGLGDRERTIVPMVQGELRAQVPVGESNLQVPDPSPDSRTGWASLRTLTVR